MSRYAYLLRILDVIRQEAVGRKHAAKYVGADSAEATNQARSRAFIHLFLKVQFGLLGFSDRECFITDGAYDGGIDGYFLAQETKTIYLIQSKFRTTEANFEDKEIALDEILAMDIDRISRGGSPRTKPGINTTVRSCSWKGRSAKSRTWHVGSTHAAQNRPSGRWGPSHFQEFMVVSLPAQNVSHRELL